MLRGSARAAYCLPDVDLSQNDQTLELDHIIAATFGWWDAVLSRKAPFDLGAFKE